MIKRIFAFAAALFAPVAGSLAQTTATVTPGDTVLVFDWSSVLANIGVAGVGIIGIMVAVTGLRYLLAVLK